MTASWQEPCSSRFNLHGIILIDLLNGVSIPRTGTVNKKRHSPKGECRVRSTRSTTETTFGFRHWQLRYISQRCLGNEREAFPSPRCWQDLGRDHATDSTDWRENRHTISEPLCHSGCCLFHLFDFSYFRLALIRLASDQKLFCWPLRCRLSCSWNCILSFLPP